MPTIQGHEIGAKCPAENCKGSIIEGRLQVDLKWEKYACCSRCFWKSRRKEPKARLPNAPISDENKLKAGERCPMCKQGVVYGSYIKKDKPDKSWRCSKKTCRWSAKMK